MELRANFALQESIRYLVSCVDLVQQAKSHREAVIVPVNHALQVQSLSTMDVNYAHLVNSLQMAELAKLVVLVLSR